MPEPFDIVQFGPNMFFVGGEIDLATAPRLEQAARSCIETGGPTMFDLSAVTFIDSTGIRAFISIARALGERAACSSTRRNLGFGGSSRSSASKTWTTSTSSRARTWRSRRPTSSGVRRPTCESDSPRSAN
jgi:ABC-type transporter Mla MlaB component